MAQIRAKAAKLASLWMSWPVSYAYVDSSKRASQNLEAPKSSFPKELLNLSFHGSRKLILECDMLICPEAHFQVRSFKIELAAHCKKLQNRAASLKTELPALC